MPRSIPTDSRSLRHAAILEQIQERAVLSQDELRDLLAARGLDATQGTLSRDLRELGVVKGHQGYTVPDDAQAHAVTSPVSRLHTALTRWLLSIRPAQHQLVLKTPAGLAGPVAIAIDDAGLQEVVGTIAGDDTVLVITQDRKNAAALMKTLTQISQ